jgi:phospholipase C
VVLMMENHSFDNILGMLGRGDGFPLEANGLPPLAAPGDTVAALASSASGPGTIPPPGSISG